MKTTFRNITGLLKRHWGPLLATIAAIFATYVAVFYVKQPLLEFEPFRQNWTALTTYWMIQEGWRLDYQTPLLGYPWAIPLEFPIYESIVALVAWMGGFPLDPVGRIVSFCFLLACAWPAFGIARRLSLPRDVAWVFCALLWSSPLYLFWGRTFMIETAAVFFILAAIPYGLDLRNPHPRWRSALAFALFATLAILQKSTTAGPVIMVMGLLVLVVYVKTNGWKPPSWRQTAIAFIAFSTPMIFGLLWTGYASGVLAENDFGRRGTTMRSYGIPMSSYVGSFNELLDFSLWKKIIWDRVLKENAAGLLGVAVIIGALIWSERDTKTVILIGLVLFVLPIIIFFQKHQYLEYYQVASVMFLLGALAVSVMAWPHSVVARDRIGAFVAVMLISSNLWHFVNGYGKRVTRDVADDETLLIADAIRRYTPEDSGILVFYSEPQRPSQFEYYSRRKGLSVKGAGEDRIGDDPASFLGGKELGAIVVCDDDLARYSKIIQRYDGRSPPSIFRIHSCYLWLPNVQSILLPSENRRVWPVGSW